MPAFANIVLDDAAATPVGHTFVPRDIVGGVATFVESTGVPVADKVVTASLRKTATGRYRGLIKASFPVVQTETINGVARPTVVRTAVAEISVSFDASSTEQERKDTVRQCVDILEQSRITSQMLTKLQGIY